MLDSKLIQKYILPVTAMFLVVAYSDKIKSFMGSGEESDYDIIRKYLLNDSPLYGKRRPKLWIHSKYEVNARKWQSFHCRNTEEINQPYIVECVQSIINHCGHSFNICLIDDESFEKLLPGWDIDLKNLTEQHRDIHRNLGILKLIHQYGGMAIPNSFLCLHNLEPIYDHYTLQKKPFVIQNVNKTVNMNNEKPFYSPDLQCFGAPKQDKHLHAIIQLLESQIKTGHNSDHSHFRNSFNNWCQQNPDKINMAGPELMGIVDKQGKHIAIEDYMGEKYIHVDDNAYGVLIPRDDLLRRTKYQWFTVAEINDIMISRIAIAKYFIISRYNHSKTDDKALATVTSI